MFPTSEKEGARSQQATPRRTPATPAAVHGGGGDGGGNGGGNGRNEVGNDGGDRGCGRGDGGGRTPPTATGATGAAGAFAIRPSMAAETADGGAPPLVSTLTEMADADGGDPPAAATPTATAGMEDPLFPPARLTRPSPTPPITVPQPATPAAPAPTPVDPPVALYTPPGTTGGCSTAMLFGGRRLHPDREVPGRGAVPSPFAVGTPEQPGAVRKFALRGMATVKLVLPSQSPAPARRVVGPPRPPPTPIKTAPWRRGPTSATAPPPSRGGDERAPSRAPAPGVSAAVAGVAAEIGRAHV